MGSYVHAWGAGVGGGGGSVCMQALIFFLAEVYWLKFWTLGQALNSYFLRLF